MKVSANAGRVRTEWLGTTYLAEPVCDDINVTLPLELHVVEFTTSYYASPQGLSILPVWWYIDI